MAEKYEKEKREQKAHNLPNNYNTAVTYAGRDVNPVKPIVIITNLSYTAADGTTADKWQYIADVTGQNKYNSNIQVSLAQNDENGNYLYVCSEIMRWLDKIRKNGQRPVFW